MNITLRDKEIIMCYLTIYHQDMISEVLNIPPLYITSAKLELNKLSHKNRNQLQRKYKKDNKFRKGLSKLKKVSDKIRMKNFYNQDIVMESLDKLTNSEQQ